MIYALIECMLLIILSPLDIVLCLGLNDINILSTLPTGEYKLNIKTIVNCDPTRGKLQFNYYLKRKSNNVTELVGNFTNTIPLDDTMFLEMNMASRDPSGEWKDNAFMQKMPKACSALKSIMGNAWPLFSQGLGLPNDCPMPEGIYIGPGLDVSVLQKSNFPKTFIYGTYKIRFFYTRNNKMCGCTVYIAEFLRP